MDGRRTALIVAVAVLLADVLAQSWINGQNVDLVVANASGRPVEISWQPAAGAGSASEMVAVCGSNSMPLSRGQSWRVLQDGNVVLDSSSASLPLLASLVAVEVWLDVDGSVRIIPAHEVARPVDALYPVCGSAIPAQGPSPRPSTSGSPSGPSSPGSSTLGSPQATRAATPTLPAEPVLVATTRTNSVESYEVAVAPLLGPMDQATARRRASEIGSLVGLGVPLLVWQQPSDASWQATWPDMIEGVPVDPDYPAILLEMDAHGGVTQFRREFGPLATKPGSLISKAQAETAAKASGHATTAEVVWAKEPRGSDSFRLVWLLRFGTLDPSANTWPCKAYVDAGTARLLDTACVS